MTTKTSVHSIQDPPVARILFGDTRVAILWLVVRLYVGYAWLDAGWHKVTDPGWIETGKSLLTFWQRVAAVPAPPARPSITFDWYRAFIQSLIDGGHHVWFAKLISVGEVLIGVALILGAFVGIAAFFGAFMNLNFMLAGTASTNPVLFTLAMFLILAWKTAGYYGLDRFLLVRLGTPWQPVRQIRATTTSSTNPSTA